MPLPRPRRGESSQDFIHRCMADPATQDITGENAENTQQRRVAACFRQWRDSQAEKAYAASTDDEGPPCPHCGMDHTATQHAKRYGTKRPTVQVPPVATAKADAPTKTVSGQTLHASDFAYVGDATDPATWKLPIHDAAHVRNALARFTQTEGLSSAAKSQAKAKILAAARRYDIAASEDDKSEKSLRIRIAKVDEAQRLVFGWASVSVTRDGHILEDLQGDVIEPDVLEKSVYRAIEAGGAHTIDAMHEGDAVGELVESFMVTPEKLAAMGLVGKRAPEVAWWVGYRVSPEIFQKVQAGDYQMLSIAGYARRVEV